MGTTTRPSPVGTGATPGSRRWAAARVYLIPLALLLAATLPHLGQGGWRTDTGRYAAVGLQAWADGPLLTLYTHPGYPWFNKPPLVMWIHGLALHVMGTELVWARLPSVAAAGLALLATIWLVRAFNGRGVALATGLVLALTYEYFRRTREVSLDLWQLAFLMTAAGMLARAVMRHRALLWALGGGAAVGLALMCKPLVGLVALPVVGLWTLVSGRPGRVWVLAPALGAAVLVAGPWHALMVARHGDAFTGQYFGAEVAARAAGQIRAYPVWYYAQQMAGTYWPWMVPLALGLIQAARGRLGRSASGARLALVWGVCWFVLISVFPDKAPRYALVVYPAMAWIAGALLASTGNGPMRRFSRRVLTPAVALACVGAAVFAFLPVRVQRPPDPAYDGLFETLAGFDSERRPAVYTVGVDTNEQARFYLRGHPWPIPADGASAVPPGSLIFRTMDPKSPIPSGEAERFRQGWLLLTERVD